MVFGERLHDDFHVFSRLSRARMCARARANSCSSKLEQEEIRI